MAKYGRLVCEVCGVDFATTYGDDGKGVIEAHHRLALAVAGASVTLLKDLALVCANRHTMRHHRRNRSIEDLRAALSSSK